MGTWAHDVAPTDDATTANVAIAPPQKASSSVGLCMGAEEERRSTLYSRCWFRLVRCKTLTLRVGRDHQHVEVDDDDDANYLGD